MRMRLEDDSCDPLDHIGYRGIASKVLKPGVRQKRGVRCASWERRLSVGFRASHGLCSSPEMLALKWP